MLPILAALALIGDNRGHTKFETGDRLQDPVLILTRQAAPADYRFDVLGNEGV